LYELCKISSLPNLRVIEAAIVAKRLFHQVYMKGDVVNRLLCDFKQNTSTTDHSEEQASERPNISWSAGFV
jgi:hypothetical protein